MRAIRFFFCIWTLGGALDVALFAVDYNCVPLEVFVVVDAGVENRAQVLCAEPAPKTRGSFPVDTGNRISFFAVPQTQERWESQFIQLSNIAFTSGLVIRFSFTSGDYSGESFGCKRDNCRTPWAFALLPTVIVGQPSGIIANLPDLTITKTHSGAFTQGDTGKARPTRSR